MKLSIEFSLSKKDKGKDVPRTLSIRIGYNRKYSYQDTGKAIRPDQYDEKEAKKGNWRVIKNHPEKDMLNKQLKILYDKVIDIENYFITEGLPFTSRMVKDKLKNHGEPANKAFLRILEEDRTIKHNTKESIKSMITRLLEYSPNVLVSQIDYEFAKSFEKWLFSRKSRTGGLLKRNTVKKYLRDLSRMLSRAIKYKIVATNQLEHYDHIKEPRANKIITYSLTFKELEMLESFDLSTKAEGMKLESLYLTLDAFLFSCYTGLRLGDLLTVSPDDYKDDVLSVYTSKGNKTVHLPIGTLFNGKALTIFKKYSRNKIGKIPLFGGELRRSTHQANLRLIKSWFFPLEKFCFHSGRHTFATLLRELNISLFYIQAFLGHSDVRTTTEVYAKQDWENMFNNIAETFKKVEG